MRFELFIATRYLRAKRRQAFIGIITGISIAGVAAGVASLIVALAINNGFRQDLQDRLIGSSSHISLLRIADDGIKDWSPLFPRYRGQWVALADDEVTVLASAPTAKAALTASTSKGEPMPILYRVPETLDTFVGYEVFI